MEMPRDNGKLTKRVHYPHTQGFRSAAVSQSIDTNPLPATLRTLRVGLDDNMYVRRTVQLAAAKIEDLEEQVARLAAELAEAGTSMRTRGRRSTPRPSRH
jgi:hypothetical protein